MWIIYAFGSAISASLTSILAKCGLKDINSTLATAIRTIVVLIMSWLMVYIVGSFNTIQNISSVSLIFLILSGLATGLSWLCYYKALQIGNINKVIVVDKTSTVLTMVLAFIFLNESLSLTKIISMFLILIGTYLMIERKKNSNTSIKYSWLIYALFSALFASLTSILGKLGITGVDSTLGTAIRTIVVLIMSWLMVFITKKQTNIKQITKHDYIFLILSGIATGASWLCYYKAIQLGPVSVVSPIDKLSIIGTIIFSRIVFKEKLVFKSLIGLIIIVVGTLLLLK